jgi:phenylalanyl-tRNA synthetase beta chain
MVRGFESDGMICSAGECGLANLFPSGEKEILDLTHVAAEPGTPLAVAIGYDDVVFEIDNKSLTNRPDLWGHHGIAREVAALYDRPLKEPPAFGALPPAGGFEVRIEAPDLSGRYSATRVAGVKASASPFWLRARLAKGRAAIHQYPGRPHELCDVRCRPTHPCV